MKDEPAELGEPVPLPKRREPAGHSEVEHEPVLSPVEAGEEMLAVPVRFGEPAILDEPLQFLAAYVVKNVIIETLRVLDLPAEREGIEHALETGDVGQLGHASSGRAGFVPRGPGGPTRGAGWFGPGFLVCALLREIHQTNERGNHE